MEASSFSDASGSTSSPDLQAQSLVDELFGDSSVTSPGVWRPKSREQWRIAYLSRPRRCPHKALMNYYDTFDLQKPKEVSLKRRKLSTWDTTAGDADLSGAVSIMTIERDALENSIPDGHDSDSVIE